MTMARRQEGATLFIALVMLVMITLLVVSAFRVSTTNLKVVSSMQGQQESIVAGQSAIDLTLSSAKFTEEPTFVGATPVNVDVNGDGTPDYVVSLNNPKPTCLKARATLPQDLDLSNPNDKPCLGSARIGAGSMTSFCTDTVWEVTATTKDTITSAETTIRQGVALRVDATDASSACK